MAELTIEIIKNTIEKVKALNGGTLETQGYTLLLPKGFKFKRGNGFEYADEYEKR